MCPQGFLRCPPPSSDPEHRATVAAHGRGGPRSRQNDQHLSETSQERATRIELAFSAWEPPEGVQGGPPERKTAGQGAGRTAADGNKRPRPRGKRGEDAPVQPVDDV